MSLLLLFSHSVMSDSLQTPDVQHARPPCCSPCPGAHSKSCPLSQLCQPTISSSIVPFASIFPSIKIFSNELAFHIRWPNYCSFSFSTGSSNEHSGLISCRTDWFDLLAYKGLSKVFSNTTVQKHQFFTTQPSLWSNSHIPT